MARMKPLADLVDGLVGPAFAAQGFASSDILAAWPDLVGPRLARVCQPQRLEWPRRRRGEDGPPDPAVLILRVEGAFALEIQHIAPVLVERINAHYGWRCVGRILLKQGRVRPRPGAPGVPVPSPEARAKVDAALDGIETERLRAALDRLGVAVVAERKR